MQEIISYIEEKNEYFTANQNKTGKASSIYMNEHIKNALSM